jgi:hypothetical protein
MIKPMVGINVPSAFSKKYGIALLPFNCTGFPLVVRKLELSSFLLKVYWGDPALFDE